MGVVSWSQAILLLNGSTHDHRPKKTTHHTRFFHPKPKFSNNQLPTYTPHRGCYTKPFLTLSKFSSSQPESCYLLSTLRGHPKSRRPFELPRLGHTDHHAAKQRNKHSFSIRARARFPLVLTASPYLFFFFTVLDHSFQH